jgi:tetratricopeptide (TPR) repeat protein
VVISLLIILAIAWLGWRQVAERFDSLKNVTSIVRIHTADRPDRIEMWKDSTKIIKDFYAAGSGLGAFEKVYPKYRVFWTDYAIDHAHNDYLELLAEGGITGFLFAACFIITLLYRSFIIIPLRKDINSIYLHTGCVAGIFSMLVFSLTDFNLHIGANGLYFFLLCALAVSSAHTRLHKGLEPTYLRKLKPGRAAPLRAVVMIVFALCVIINGGVLAGKYFFSSFDRNRPSDKTDAARLAALGSDIRKASLFDPLNAKYYYTSGLIERGLGNAEASITLLDYAATLDPMNGEYLQRLGLSLFEKGRTEAGDRLIRAATIHDAANPDRQRFYAVHLFMTGKKEAAAECIRRALLMAPDRTADFIILMMLRGMTDDEIQKTLPDRAAPHIAFAEYLAQTNKHAAAEQEFREALGYAAKEKSTSRDYFLRAYNYYVKRERFDDALWTMKQAIILFPNEGSLYYTIGTLYERLGMDTTAIDAYKKAVSLDVTQSDAQKRTDVLMRKAGKRD